MVWKISNLTKIHFGRLGKRADRISIAGGSGFKVHGAYQCAHLFRTAPEIGAKLPWRALAFELEVSKARTV